MATFTPAVRTAKEYNKVIQSWIDSMKDSPRKKSLYPSIVRAIINSAIKEYNDYENDVIRFRFNPFTRIKWRDCCSAGYHLRTFQERQKPRHSSTRMAVSLGH